MGNRVGCRRTRAHIATAAPYCGGGFHLVFRPSEERGFTLIELIAVIAILGMMLFFAVPRFNGPRGDDEKSVSRWMMANVAHYKTRAVEDQKRYMLTVELDANALSVTREAAEENAFGDKELLATFRLSTQIQLLNVEYPGKGAVSTGKTDISFYPRGYSDKAVIHLRDEDGQVISFLIEPFLPTVGISTENIHVE